jgi:hypothetical protein
LCRTGRLRPALLALVFLGVAGAIADDRSRLIEPGPWKTGELVPIAVSSNGTARFDLPSRGEREKTLVVVSSLARGKGPYAVRLTARPASKAKAVTLACRGPRKSPVLGPAEPIPPGDRSASRPPQVRTFNLLVRPGDPARAENYTRVRGQLRALGDRVQVYIDDRVVDTASRGLLDDIVATFDRQIYPTAARLWGPARDVDGDGRFTILLADGLSAEDGETLGVDGFVRGADLDTSLVAPFSNHCDMMYLSPALPPGPHLRTILAHEYAHAATFSHRTSTSGRPACREEEGWLDEAIAHLVEDLHGFSRSNLDYRVSAFLSAPERYQLVVPDYYAAELFRSHGNRGSTYLFLRWCAGQYGPGLLPSLIRSEKIGVANLEAATGVNFAELYRRWSAALFLDRLQPSPAQEDHRGDGWVLAGPRAGLIVPDGTPVSWTLTGTSTHYVTVAGSTAGAVSIEVTGPPEAQLQVTAVQLPDDLPRVELTVQQVPNHEGPRRVRVLAQEHDGVPVTLESLAWEPLVPRRKTRGEPSSHGRLDARGLRASFGSLELAAGSRVASNPITLTGTTRDSGPTVLKLVGIDPHGRRVTAWAEIP